MKWSLQALIVISYALIGSNLNAALLKNGAQVPQAFAQEAYNALKQLTAQEQTILALIALNKVDLENPEWAWGSIRNEVENLRHQSLVSRYWQADGSLDPHFKEVVKASTFLIFKGRYPSEPLLRSPFSWRNLLAPTYWVGKS